VVASYIDEPVVRKGAGTGGTIHYYHRNQQYSVTAITTAAAAIAERYAYTAYGLPTILNASATIIASSAVSNRYTYTGREWDATLGLHHFRARWMSPIAGRFLGRDPIGYEDGASLYYSYFAVQYVDPFGLDKKLPPNNFPDPPHPKLPAPPAPNGGGLMPGQSNCTVISRSPFSNGGYFHKQFFIGIVPVFFQWGYQLAGSIEVEDCKRCCSDFRQVNDRRTTANITGEFWGSAGIGFSFREQGKHTGGWLIYGYLGIKLDVRTAINLTGTIESDKCNGIDAGAEICGSATVTGRISGGGLLSFMFGWYTVDVGAEIYGQSACKAEVCFNVNSGKTSADLSCSAPEVYARACAGICFTKRLF
jgi:RHS repeat-associated protein